MNLNPKYKIGLRLISAWHEMLNDDITMITTAYLDAENVMVSLELISTSRVKVKLSDLISVKMKE